jgi:hypothetical protein
MERVSAKVTFEKLKVNELLDHKEYTEDKLPEFLSDLDWYFKNYDPCVDMDALRQISDSEKIVPLPTEQEQDDELLALTDKKIINLNTYMDAMNDTLLAMRKGLDLELSNSIGFWSEIVRQGSVPLKIPDVICPPHENLQLFMFDMYERLNNELMPLT